MWISATLCAAEADVCVEAPTREGGMARGKQARPTKAPDPLVCPEAAYLICSGQIDLNAVVTLAHEKHCTL